MAATSTNSSVREMYEEAKKEEIQFRGIIPKSGFIGKYMRYTDRQESPGSYHFWVAATILSATVQRRAWISKGMYNVYPSLYTVLVGPSGRCRKTRAMRLGTDLIEEFSWVNVIADKTSPEAFLQALMDGTDTMAGRNAPNATGGININLRPPDSTGFIRTTELGVFVNNQTYTSGMVSILTDLYDCPSNFKYLTRNGKPIVLSNVAVSFLGATTQKWLATNLPAGAFEGGFMSRFILVVKNVRDRHISFPEEPPHTENRELREMLLAIHSTFKGEIPLTNEARDWFDDWYTSGEAEILENEQMSGFVERKPDTVLKLALILAASEESDVISAQMLKNSKNILDWTQDRMFDAFKHVDVTRIGALVQKVVEAIRLNGGRMRKRDILRKYSSSLNGVKDLEDIEQMLEGTGDISIKFWRAEGKDTGPPRKGYVLKGFEKYFNDLIDVTPDGKPWTKRKTR